jgi:hypothetical protein
MPAIKSVLLARQIEFQGIRPDNSGTTLRTRLESAPGLLLTEAPDGSLFVTQTIEDADGTVKSQWRIPEVHVASITYVPERTPKAAPPPPAPSKPERRR